MRPAFGNSVRYTRGVQHPAAMTTLSHGISIVFVLLLLLLLACPLLEWWKPLPLTSSGGGLNELGVVARRSLSCGNGAPTSRRMDVACPGPMCTSCVARAG